MFAMTFSTTVLTSCHDDDKKYEEVEDPLRSQTAYYIAGTITDANGPLAGATVKSGEYSATTDAKGVYSLTVNKTGIYTLTVTAEGHDDYEATAEFTDGTANHSLMVVNVKMSTTIEFGEMQEADGSTIEAPKIENPEKVSNSGSGIHRKTVEITGYRKNPIEHLFGITYTKMNSVIGFKR